VLCGEKPRKEIWQWGTRVSGRMLFEKKTGGASRGRSLCNFVTTGARDLVLGGKEKGLNFNQSKEHQESRPILRSVGCKSRQGTGRKRKISVKKQLWERKGIGVKQSGRRRWFSDPVFKHRPPPSGGRGGTCVTYSHSVQVTGGHVAQAGTGKANYNGNQKEWGKPHWMS